MSRLVRTSGKSSRSDATEREVTSTFAGRCTEPGCRFAVYTAEGGYSRLAGHVARTGHECRWESMAKGVVRPGQRPGGT